MSPLRTAADLCCFEKLVSLLWG